MSKEQALKVALAALASLRNKPVPTFNLKRS